MSCVVPFCDPDGQSFTLRFPRNQLLIQRWCQAIELGTGVALPDPLDPLLAEVCQQHFQEVDEYSEPIIFQNASLGRQVHLASCRLCLEFDYAEKFIPAGSGTTTIGTMAIGEALKAIGCGIQLTGSDFLDNICEECLVRLDLAVALRRKFFECSKSFQRMGLFIREENRLRYKRVPKVEVVEEVLQDEQVGSSEFLVAVEPLVKVETKPEIEMIDLDLTDIVEEDDDQEIEEEYIEQDDDCKDGSAHEDVSVEAKNEADASDELPKTQKRKRGRPRGSGQPNMSRKRCKLKGLTERKCYMCVQLFETAEELFSHMVEHVDHNLTCEACDESFPNLTKYNRHLSKHDPVERPIKCDHCELRFTDRLGKRRHEKLKHNVDHAVTTFSYADRPKGKFTCQHCGKQCMSLSFLKEHEDAHAGIKRHECKSCGRLFANKNNLERHHLIHTSEKPYKCEVCGKAFRQSPMYKDHLRLHSGETPYACNGCELRFTSTTLLRKHKIRHHGSSSAQSQTGLALAPRAQNCCRFCTSTFKRHSLLVEHIQRTHSNEEVQFFQCQTCEQRFVDQAIFESHERNHEKNFQCGYCDRAFSSLQALKAHEPMHDGVRGYTCKTCSKTFSHVANLKRHELLHQGIKKHECDFCGKRFAQSNQLHTHRRTHTGEKPYECQMCGKRFADNSTLCKHRKSVCKTDVGGPVVGT
ncbi:zinc finger protein ZFP2 [Aedes albopictus]|uniref:C2H2-type domain-containing protein n=1 Tax=Aedes albopictus TaxID=7160 RepID=A0ABM2A0P6_AEDAL